MTFVYATWRCITAKAVIALLDICDYFYSNRGGRAPSKFGYSMERVGTFVVKFKGNWCYAFWRLLQKRGCLEVISENYIYLFFFLFNYDDMLRIS